MYWYMFNNLERIKIWYILDDVSCRFALYIDFMYLKCYIMQEFWGQYWKHKDVPKKRLLLNAIYMISTWYLYDIYMRWCDLCIVESVDVNVTPDKRQIFMENEKILLATIKVSILLRENFFLLATIKHRMLLLCWPLISHITCTGFLCRLPWSGFMNLLCHHIH